MVPRDFKENQIHRIHQRVHSGCLRAGGCVCAAASYFWMSSYLPTLNTDYFVTGITELNESGWNVSHMTAF